MKLNNNRVKERSSAPLPPIPTTDFGVEYPPLLEALDWSNCFSLGYDLVVSRKKCE